MDAVLCCAVLSWLVCSGKTTLLNMLAKRTKGGKSEGEVSINDRPRKEIKHFKRLAAYVTQEDIMLNNLTPKETFTFSAQLRLPSDMPDSEKRALVASLIDELGLQKCRDTIIGEPGLKRGISGGERKRVNIGMEVRLPRRQH